MVGTLLVYQYKTQLVLLLAVSLLTGCDVQTPWSREYHLRQYEQLTALGDRARVIDSNELSADYYQKALDELKQTGPKPAQLAQAYEDVAESKLLSKQYSDASKKFQIAMTLYKNQKPLNIDFAFARSMTGLGVAQLQNGETAKAVSTLKEAAGIVKVLAQDSHHTNKNDLTEKLKCGWIPQLCQHSCLYWLTLAKTNSNPLEKSEFEILINDPSTCSQVKQLAAVSFCKILRAQGNETKAAKIEASLGILQNVDSPKAAKTHKQYELATKKAKQLEKQGDFKSADLAYCEALQFCRQAQPSSDTRLMTALCNLAYFYLNNGAWAQAIPLLEESIKIQNERFGPTDRALAMPHTRLGRALLSSGQLEKAELEAQQGYQLAIKGYGNNNQFTARAEIVLAAIEKARKSYSDAERHTKHALTILRKDPDRNSKAVAEGLSNLVEMEFVQDNIQASLAAAEEASNFAQEHGDYLDQLRCLKAVCNIYMKMDKRDRAIATLKQAHELLDDASQSPSWQKWA
ncbi:MAG: tetratricopeptide repeat protein, partial [Candidatus Obscuribacterales bacterium]|nr:tetratricopeptide repeat protein [Candidatus Obscuribacterales bacterium]